MKLPLKTSNALFVAGEWVTASESAQPVINPANEEVIGLAPVGGKAEVESAIAAARRAFDRGPWPRMSPEERGAKMRHLHAVLLEDTADITRLITEEAGAVRRFFASQFDLPMRLASYTVEAGSRSRDVPLPIGVAPNAAGVKGLVGGIVRREPVGVVSAITPY